jgi:hypothetical protein
MLYRLKEAFMQAMERLLTAALGLLLGSGVWPLLAKNCYSCHTSKLAGLRLDSPDALRKAGPGRSDLEQLTYPYSGREDITA